jgi:hypothetical protein
MVVYCTSELVAFSLTIVLPAKISPAVIGVFEGRNINCSDTTELLSNPNQNLIFVDTSSYVFAFGGTQR